MIAQEKTGTEEGSKDWTEEARHLFLVVGLDDREYALLCIQCGLFQWFLSI
jgi:hypothetical protein